MTHFEAQKTSHIGKAKTGQAFTHADLRARRVCRLMIINGWAEIDMGLEWRPVIEVCVVVTCSLLLQHGSVGIWVMVTIG